MTAKQSLLVRYDYLAEEEVKEAYLDLKLMLSSAQT